jgi:integrase
MSVKIRKRNGAWWVFICYHGQRKAKKIGTRAAAQCVKAEIEARLALGDFRIFSEKKTVTFSEYAERWLREYAEVHCKPSTVASYRQLLRLYVSPEFGTMRLDEISRDRMKEFLARLVATGRLSRNTLRLILCTIRVIFNHAIEDGIVLQNPAARLGRFAKSEKPKFQASALTREEAESLLNASKEICPEYYPLFLTALRAGLRRGEVVAFKWGDIQFGESEEDKNRYILVQRNYAFGRFTTPKSRKSRRVDLSRELRRVLLELRDKRLLGAFLNGRSCIADELVFPSNAGTVLDPSNMVHNYFLPSIERAGLRRIRFHDLRHTFGSLLIQQGASLAYVKEQMGHSSIQVTVDTYGHLIPGADIAWVDKLDSETSPQLSATQAQPAEKHEEPETVEVLENDGEPRRTRTCNPLIKSQLLYQLS